MNNNIPNLDSKSFDKFIKEDTVVVDFWAEWCGPCKIMGPILEETSKEIKGRAKFGKVNVDNNSELTRRFGVMSIPTLMFFRDGEPVDKVVGVIRKEELIKKVKTIK